MALVMTATPLAMHEHAYAFGDTAWVIQWHILGMFAPSFFTGALIRRLGVLTVMLAGAVLNSACVLVNLSGTSLEHYWLALLLLGIGWNFLFIGATQLLTETYASAEKGKTQALNDFLVFTMVTLAVLSAGHLQHYFGWRTVNLGVVPLILVTFAALAWLIRQRRQPVTG
jgi:MFS family permease